MLRWSEAIGPPQAAPYIHARLSSVSATIRKVTSIKDLSDEELTALAAQDDPQPDVAGAPPGLVH